MSVLSKLIEVIISAGAINGFFIALILTTNKNRERQSNKILAALLIVLSVSIVHSMLFLGNLDPQYRIREPFILLVGPLLLFYFRECTGLQPSKRFDVLHFIPFVLFFLFFLSMVAFSQSFRYTEFLNKQSVCITTVMWTFGIVQYGFYWGTVLRLFHKHMLNIESEFSNTEGKTLSWMKNFVHIFGLCVCSLVITIPIVVHSGNYSLVITIANCTLSITIFVLGYEGLFQEDVFSNSKTLQPITEGLFSKQDTNNTLKAAEEVKKFVPDLLKYLEEKKPYLNEGLTLSELAKQVGMSRNQLSFVINNGIGDSFYAFINKYRVEEAKRLIADPKNANFTILSLAYEAGFPSKSSFHNIFKKLAGITPAEYRSSFFQS